MRDKGRTMRGVFMEKEEGKRPGKGGSESHETARLYDERYGKDEG